MKKYSIIAIIAFCALALASCTKVEKISAVPSDATVVHVVLNAESTRATITNPTSQGAGFVFQNGDVINWVSKNGNGKAIYSGPDAATINIEISIPGLAKGNVSGYFAVNFTDEVPFSYNTSNPTQKAEGINSDTFFIASKTMELTKGTTSASLDLNIVGGLLAFQFKGADETILKVEVEGATVWSGNGTYDGEELTFTPVLKKVATNVNFALTGNYDTQCVFVPVPDDVPIPFVNVYTMKGKYTFKINSSINICPEGDLIIESGEVKKFKFNLANADDFAPWSKGEIKLTADMISTNDPMQYVVGGSDIYGFQSNPDWFTPITPTQAYVRELKYGKVENMWDDDASTCYHLNLDWGQPNTSWGQRSVKINPNREEKRYIQITLPDAVESADLSFTNADSGAEAEGYEILASSDGTNFSKSLFTGNLSSDFGEENNLTDVSLSKGNPIKAIRIQNTKSDADWTYIKSAFGIAELSISTILINLVDSGKVTGVSLNKSVMYLPLGSSETLTAIISPDTAEVKDVNWSSSDVTVATVDNGSVTGAAVGEAIITAKTVDGGYSATCTVTVVDE